VNPRSLIQRAAGIALGIVLFIAALVFASVLLAVAAVVALLVWAWLWWRTRNLPKSRRGSVVIEGEYRVEPEQPGRLEDDETRRP
jgi:HAMP domain-containing protein